MKTWLRVGAGVGLAVLLYWLTAHMGLWEVALLVALGAGLGGVIARPPRPPAYKPTYWVRKDLGL